VQIEFRGATGVVVFLLALGTATAAACHQEGSHKRDYGERKQMPHGGRRNEHDMNNLHSVARLPDP
jgi:hypothetical protein